MEAKFQNSVLAVEEEDLSFGFKAIKRKMNGQDAKNFTSVANEVADRYKAEGRIGTYMKVKSIIHKFVAYMGSENFAFQDIDIRVLNDYQQYLIEKYHNQPVSINSNLNFIKLVFNYAQRMEYIAYICSHKNNIRMITTGGWIERYNKEKLQFYADNGAQASEAFEEYYYGEFRNLLFDEGIKTIIRGYFFRCCGSGDGDYYDFLRYSFQ